MAVKAETRNRVKGIIAGNGNGSGPAVKDAKITINPQRWEEARFGIESIEPLVINRFSKKSEEMIRDKHASGQRGMKGAAKEPKDFDALYRGSMFSADGWYGINAMSFKHAMVEACVTAGFHKSKARTLIHVIADGHDDADGTPLVRITSGKPRKIEHITRVKGGSPDIRVRAMWDKWSATVRVRYDADWFSLSDIANLLMRAGNGGVGEGRNSSKQSVGMGWGSFRMVSR